jgi:hypothetical protein
MNNHIIISSEMWEIRLPSDWEQRECSSRQDYFESADGTMGVYISTWNLSNDPTPARQLLESFRSVEVESFTKMKGRTWKSVNKWSSDTQNLSVLGEDFLDHKNRYRIVCQLIARLPWLVRATFHDYDCADYAGSKQFFQPIIDSLKIHNET